MKTNKLIVVIIVMLTFTLGYSQKRKVRHASQEYDNFGYVKTSEILLEVANKGFLSVDLLQKLGNSFYFNNQMEEASQWYCELMALNEIVDSEYYFRYAQSLKAIENYKESDKWMVKFHSIDRADLRGKAFASKVDYLAKIEESSRGFEIKNLDINSEVSDFGSMQYNGDLIFASSRGGGKKYQWNEQPFLDLFSAEKLADGRYGNVKEFGEDINSKLHESSVAFSPDEKVIYFTRNNYRKAEGSKYDDETTLLLKVYRARRNDDGQWKDIESLSFNSDSYSVAHPSVNAKGTKLYFASDMPRTYGRSDIFMVDIHDDGTFGEPENLGESINTEGQETFPYINSDGDLYFSSNGLVGLGGLDVFVVRDFENRHQNKESLVLENIAKPVNSPKDDFGYYENLGTNEGFFSSNRDGGKGDDDIYSFSIPKCKQTIAGVVKDKETLELLSGAVVTLFDGEGKQLDQATTGAVATFKFEALACDKEYLIRGSKIKYASEEVRAITPNSQQKLTVEILLQPDEQEIKVGDDLAKTLDIPMIYFDFDKSKIRYDAEVELQKVLAVMNKYPTLIVDIRSHTDCRGRAKYNEKLSDKRAQSTRIYLIEKGIAADRLTAKGYGESQLVNDCGCEPTNKSNCTQAQHQLNRRSEFIIINY